MSTYKLTCWNDTYTITADLAQASAPVLVDGRGTPFQTADFRHSEAEMAEGIAEWLYYETTDSADAADAAVIEAIDEDDE